MVEARVCSPYTHAVLQLGEIGKILAEVSRDIRTRACEVRLRRDKPVIIHLEREIVTLSHIVTSDELEECFCALCRYSVYCFENEIREGFITLRGGHRAGFCGTAVYKDGKLVTLKNISSINLRIAREFIGCAENLRMILRQPDFRGLLIAGRPMSAKTTLLRDLCRIISEENKVSVIDTRGELAAVCDGCSQLSLGMNSDVLDGYSKRDGIIAAVRVLSPQFIACDEVTGEEESLEKAILCGVKIIATVHAYSLEEALLSDIVKTGAFSHLAFADNERLGRIKTVVRIGAENGV